MSRILRRRAISVFHGETFQPLGIRKRDKGPLCTLLQQTSWTKGIFLGRPLFKSVIVENGDTLKLSGLHRSKPAISPIRQSSAAKPLYPRPTRKPKRQFRQSVTRFPTPSQVFPGFIPLNDSRNKQFCIRPFSERVKILKIR